MRQPTVVELEHAGMSQNDFRDARADVARDGRAALCAFVCAEALKGLYTAVDETPYDGSDLRGATMHAVHTLGKKLGYRQGGPRTRSVPDLDRNRRRAVLAVGEETGMTAEVTDDYDGPADVLVPHGSYAEAIALRLRLGKALWDAQVVADPDRPLTVMGLTTDRRLTDEDKLSSIPYPASATTEGELFSFFMSKEFDGVPGDTVLYTTDEDGVPYATGPGVLQEYKLPDGTLGYVVHAPRVRGTLAANTGDTQEFAARVLGRGLLLGKHVVGQTAHVYKPFQRFDLVRTVGLPNGATVGMAGYHDVAWTEPAHVEQEIKSAFIQGLQMLDAIEVVERT